MELIRKLLGINKTEYIPTGPKTERTVYPFDNAPKSLTGNGYWYGLQEGK